MEGVRDIFLSKGVGDQKPGSVSLDDSARQVLKSRLYERKIAASFLKLSHFSADFQR